MRRAASGWIHRPMATPISMFGTSCPDGRDGVADVHGIERLVAVRIARMDVHRGDPQPGHRPGVSGQVSGQHG